MNLASNTVGKFFIAQAVRIFSLGNSIIREGTELYVAKWNDVFVITRDGSDFSVVSAENGPTYIKTVRKNGLPVPAKRVFPKITGKEEQFQWRVEGGHTCTDGCCSSTQIEETVKDKSAALELAQRLELGSCGGPTGFVTVRGPGFYQHNWNRPEM